MCTSTMVNTLYTVLHVYYQFGRVSGEIDGKLIRKLGTWSGIHDAMQLIRLDKMIAELTRDLPSMEMSKMFRHHKSQPVSCLPDVK